MGRKKIGLALSGGGARGFAHVGVLKVLAEHNIPIDMIAGTSAGSIVGGAFASGMGIDDIERMALRMRWRHLIRPSFSTKSLLTNAPMARLMDRYFPVTRFEEMTVPFSAVACDLSAEECVLLKDTGDVVTAIRASCAVPGFFSPVRDKQGRMLVDGGLVAAVPIDAVREMGADVVIAVDLLASGATFRRTTRTAYGMLFSSALMLLRTASKIQKYNADVTVIPAISHIRPDRLNLAKESIKLGEAAAREKIDEIKAAVMG